MVRILYGMPTQKAVEQGEQGSIILGGCVVVLNAPRIGCPTCNYGEYPEDVDADESLPQKPCG